jgi:hypothetical protein
MVGLWVVQLNGSLLLEDQGAAVVGTWDVGSSYARALVRGRRAVSNKVEDFFIPTMRY